MGGKKARDISAEVNTLTFNVCSLKTDFDLKILDTMSQHAGTFHTT